MEFAGVTRFDERRRFGVAPGLDHPGAEEFGVEPRAEQDGDVSQPQPDQEDDDTREGAVGLVVRGEVRDVDGE